MDCDVEGRRLESWLETKIRMNSDGICKYLLHVSQFYYAITTIIIIIMVALWNRADHYIFILSFVVLLLSFFFPRLISAVAEWMSAILAHMVWP